jgi:pilus assembly protein Flp/PilA
VVRKFALDLPQLQNSTKIERYESVGGIMKHLKLIYSNFLKDESGQDMIEYALVVALVGLFAITTLRSLANGITGIFNTITSDLGNAL